jgi:hemerythrin-like metal-binding protein
MEGPDMLYADDRYGIEELDRQHEEVDSAIISLSEAVKEGRPGDETHALLMRLDALLRFHFSVEVSLMQIMTYPFIVQHVAAHSGILRDMEELIQFSIENGKLEGLGDSLETTFAQGIFKHDKVFIEFVRAHKAALMQTV